ncbi:unnamed protein product [Prorocentrum cordatum]|uniref:Tafazzin family protein n=1 Tax=Prorocentrum cordatum TaxID=2364126 RepID=A0ABN9TFS5_9DINO|nr:unnamed protein product [Polarella glacialis]
MEVQRKKWTPRGGKWKTSLRLVWPDIIVDLERAHKIRALLVNSLSSISSDLVCPLGVLQSRLLHLCDQNCWGNVVGNSMFSLFRNGVRMPLCDKFFKFANEVFGKRPFVPVGILRFTYGLDGKLAQKSWLRQAMTSMEWLQLGCLRQPTHTSLTQCNLP